MFNFIKQLCIYVGAYFLLYALLHQAELAYPHSMELLITALGYGLVMYLSTAMTLSVTVFISVLVGGALFAAMDLDSLTGGKVVSWLSVVCLMPMTMLLSGLVLLVIYFIPPAYDLALWPGLLLSVVLAGYTALRDITTVTRVFNSPAILEKWANRKRRRA